MRFALAAALFATILAVDLPPADAQSARSDADATANLDEAAYRALLERYRSGDFSGAVQQALETDRETMARRFQVTVARMNVDIQHLARLLSSKAWDVPLNRARADRLHVLRLAALLHTVAALKVATYNAQLLEQQLRLAHEVTRELWKLQSDFDRFGPVPPLPVETGGPGEPSLGRADPMSWADIRTFVRFWHLVIASRLQDVASFDVLKPTLASGLERFRDDPELLLARGSVSEAEGSLLLVDRSLAARIYGSNALNKWRSMILDAQTDFDRARRGEPALVEATLRWGRTRLLAGDEGDAKAAFTEVATINAPMSMRYLALLFDGARAEAEKKTDQAQHAYQQALAVIPNAASALLALSRLAERAGDGAAARDWALKAIRKSPVEIDPWASYSRGQAGRLEERLAAFERLALQ